MPMIDVYAAEGTFSDKHSLAQNLAQAVMRWKQVPGIPLFSDNTAAVTLRGGVKGRLPPPPSR